MQRIAARGLAITYLVALSGCALYLDDSHERYCDQTGCYECRDGKCGAGAGGSCASNWDCPAGCYCSGSGSCEEAGSCYSETECGPGYRCQVERYSCVPDGTGGGCQRDADCGSGYFCDELAGVCRWGGSCGSAGQCEPGHECNPTRRTCEPIGCTDDEQCPQGAYCEQNRGECVATGTCDGGSCPDGHQCDSARNTCVPCTGSSCGGSKDPGSCNGAVTCGDAPPVCPSGTVPGIADGCYTGFCIPLAACDVPPPPSCEELTSETDCQARAGECQTLYTGINCSCGPGCSCEAQDAGCTCESFEYVACRSR
jgi:hypothetical protein